MLIHFIHTGDAYLPELQAYADFVRQAGHQAELHRQIDTLPPDAAVLWWMCGNVSRQLAQRWPQAFHIHEYASASVPPLACLKDRVKRWHQALPHYRIFQNDWVRTRLGFADEVPFAYRDMGLSDDFFAAPAPASASGQAPEFDAVYLGEMQRLQHFMPVFDALAQLRRRVLLVGQVPPDLLERLQRHGNIDFAGRVAYSQVPAQLRRARFGLNLVPDQLPYTEQTSTKLLEYCAAGLRVVSTRYPWVVDFERRHAARFAYLAFQGDAPAYAQALDAALAQPDLRVPDLRALTWTRLLADVPIWQRLGIRA